MSAAPASSSSLAPLSVPQPADLSPITPPTSDSYQQTQSELDRLKQRLLSLAVSPDGSSDTLPAAAAQALAGDADALRVQISQLAHDRDRLEAELRQTVQLYDQEKRLHSSASQAVTALRKRSEDLERLLTDKQNELVATQRDLQIMGEKLVDEIERRAELQHSKEAVQDELEQLTSQLFEEANVMVAKEAQKSFMMEKTSKVLEAELAQTKLRLEAESTQLWELRKKMEQFQAEREAQDDVLNEAIAGGNPAAVAAVAASLSLARNEPGSRSSFHSEDPRRSMDSRTGDTAEEEDPGLDPAYIAEFVDFVVNIPTLRLNSIGKLPFMKSTLEDDIEPVLRFGGNPQVSTRKVIESIVENRIFIQEMPPTPATPSAPANMGGAGPQHGATGPAPVLPRASSSSESSLAATISSYTGYTYQTAAASAFKQPISEKSVWERIQGLPGVGPPNVCQACGLSTPTGHACRFQFRLSDADPWSALCGTCRDRLVSACDFYNFLRHVKSGLMQNRPSMELYWEALRLKRQMFYARNGCMHMAAQERGFGRWKSMRNPQQHGRAGTPDPAPAATRSDGDLLRRNVMPSSPSPLNPNMNSHGPPAPSQSAPLPNGTPAGPGDPSLPQLAMPPLKR